MKDKDFYTEPAEFDSQGRIPVTLLSETKFLITIQVNEDGRLTPFTSFGQNIPAGEWLLDFIAQKIRG